ncbi:MAG: hypothetical protein ABIL68_04460 [bacterium]
MKKICGTMFIVFILLCASSLLNAQAAMNTDKMRFGFGAALGKEVFMIGESASFNSVDFPSFYFPMYLSSTLKIEPYFGYWKYSSKNSDEYNQSFMHIGVGAFFVKWCNRVSLQFGGRVGMVHSSYFSKHTSGTESYEYKASKSDIFFGPALGAECFVCTNLSLGGEIQFMYGKMGNWKYKNGHDSESDEKQYMMTTKTLFFVRWYLGCDQK